ncbi:MAG TPA: ABC transporter substrate-binding protein [Candidatus Limnocylindrales bacterium]|nr:ABC transporter substrate-binding protein [Candidatus Limnocylindrales bacterium]
MRPTLRPAAAALLALLTVAACSTGAASPSATAPASSEPPAPASSAPASIEPSPSAEACSKESLATKTPGTLTIGADNPAFPPYYLPPAEGETGTEGWELGDPYNGQGLEAATAYAIAEQLGFSRDEVTWVPVPFNNAIQPGPKDFDLYLTQVSYSPERAEAVDLSEGYFDVSQSVISLADNAIANAKSVADLKQYKLAAPVGTTSLTYITDTIQPTQEPAVYDTLDAAIQALIAGQVDGVVVDLPTAFFATAVQLTNGRIVGSLPQIGESTEYFSAVLDKDSPLTVCVNEAIAALEADGTLDAIRQEWITSQGAPELAP